MDAVLKRLNERFPANSGVRFIQDSRTSQILAYGPAAVQQQIVQVVQASGGGAVAGLAANATAGAAADVGAAPRGPKVVPLRHLGWREFEGQLTAIFGKTLPVTLEHGGDWARYSLDTRGGRVNLIVDRKAGQVALEGPVRLADAWARVIESIDEHPRQANDDTRVVPLGAAKTADVVKALSVFRNAAATTNTEATGTAAADQTPSGGMINMIFQPRTGDANSTQLAQCPAQSRRRKATILMNSNSKIKMLRMLRRRNRQAMKRRAANSLGQCKSSFWKDSM